MAKEKIVRRGRPTSFNLESVVEQGEYHVADYVKEGSLRRDVLQVIENGVGRRVGEVLGAEVPGRGYKIRSVDVWLAIRLGYVVVPE